MKIFVLNCGSSSIKYQLIDMKKDEAIARGIVAKIGEQGSYIQHESLGGLVKKEVHVQDHKDGLKLIIEYLLHEKYGALKELAEISAVGHRVVHGGEAFTEPSLITDKVIEKIKECINLAPLHNPANLIGIEEARKMLPDIPHVAVFDTAFHQTMPKKAYMYAVPYEFYEKYGIRKYGFHGTSCRYASKRAAEVVGKPLDQLKIIVCHLGNGVTLNAIDRGMSVDTSMGLTPLEGLMMGTRCGDIDPGAILYLLRKLNLTVQELEDILNKRSGLLGISGVSNDVRELIREMEKGNERCKLALEVFAYRVKKYIGAYVAILGGIDVLVFTAGIGENSPLLRSMICRNLNTLGIILDEELNAKIVGVEGLISTQSSAVKVLVIPTNEEKEIALSVMEVIRRKITER